MKSNINIEKLKEIISDNLKDKSFELKRVFHGRGNFYDDYNYLVVDSINDVLLATFFEQIDLDIQEDLFKLFDEIYKEFAFKSLIIQRRYNKENLYEVFKGEIPFDCEAIENGLKYKINFTNQNIGIFPDMKIGREFIQSICKEKNVLNLFSYTCAFSVAAISVGASKVVNVDMSKSALTIGRENHRINNLEVKKVKFLPYNILKSWSRIKKEGPYDIIIIDPPSFQKGSFAATQDYEKIIKRLTELAAQECIVLSCLNAPELDTSFIKNIFSEFASDFNYEKRLENLETFPAIDDEKALKNLVFKKE